MRIFHEMVCFVTVALCGYLVLDIFYSFIAWSAQMICIYTDDKHDVLIKHQKGE